MASSSAPSSLPQDPPPSASGIHILIGKVRRPQQQQQQEGKSGAAEPPPPPQYDPLWATFHMCRSTISYEGFTAALSASANEVVAAAQQQQPEEKDAVTVFSPIGKYTLHHVTPQPRNAQPGHFNPPPTSLLSLPSKRTPPDPKRPVWIDFYIHSTPQPQPEGSDHQHQTRFTSELDTRLRTLDFRLSNGPGRRNTLGLAEIPAAALQVTVSPSPGGDNATGAAGDVVSLILPPISRPDWACAVELRLLATTLNGLGPSSRGSAPPPLLLMLLQEAVTLMGRLGEDDNDPDLRLRRENFEELLRHLAEGGGLVLAYADDAVATQLENALRGGGTRGDDDGHIVSQTLPVKPGFMALMLTFLEKRVCQIVEDRERALHQEVWARFGPTRENEG